MPSARTDSPSRRKRRLREEEDQLGKLKAERTATAKRAGPGVMPTPKVIAGYVKNLLALLETDTIRGREVLARFVAPIVMTPKAEGPTAVTARPEPSTCRFS